MTDPSVVTAIACEVKVSGGIRAVTFGFHRKRIASRPHSAAASMGIKRTFLHWGGCREKERCLVPDRELSSAAGRILSHAAADGAIARNADAT
jgi:hypothetical protein